MGLDWGFMPQSEHKFSYYGPFLGGKVVEVFVFPFIHPSPLYVGLLRDRSEAVRVSSRQDNFSQY